MKKVVIGCLVACTFGAASSAIAVESPNWTGFYLGVNGGWGWSSIDTTISPVGTVSKSDFNSQALNQDINGALFGVQLGYNYNFKNHWVIGIEGDFDGASLNGTEQTSAPSKLNPNGSTDSFKVTDKIDWLTSIRPRVGYQFGSGLAYVTGGIAWANINRTSQVNAETAPAVYGANASTDSSSTRSGWALGVGYEWMMAKNWTVRGEYIHYGFSQTDNDYATFSKTSVPGQSNMNVSTGSSNIDVFRVGVNYKF